jgi:hypothetical protein
MSNKEDSLVWLQRRTTRHQSERGGMDEVVKDFDEVGKLGQGFTSVDKLERVNLG